MLTLLSSYKIERLIKEVKLKKKMVEQVKEGTETWNNYLDGRLAGLRLVHTYKGEIGDIDNGCVYYNDIKEHKIEEKYIPWSFHFPKVIATIVSEPNMAKPFHTPVPYHLKYDGLEIRVEEPSYEDKIRKILEEFENVFHESAKLILK